MIVRGVDTSALRPQFEGCVRGRTLILDGDGPAYVAAATVKRLDTAVRRFQTSVLSAMFLAQAESCSVHLTAQDSLKAGRFMLVGAKPYQGNRQSKDKPALLEPLRSAMANRENWLPEFTVHLHRSVEADDGMIAEAYRLKEFGVIRSEDKDLRITPYPYYDIERGKVLPSQEFGWLTPKVNNSGTVKLIGQGPLFFWAQMLMGDSADNVRGLLKYNDKQCGPVLAYDVLKDARDVHEAANLVLSAYRVIDQNPLPEGYMLWLLRWPGDTFWNYCSELNLTTENKEYLLDCTERLWYNTAPA